MFGFSSIYSRRTLYLTLWADLYSPFTLWLPMEFPIKSDAVKSRGSVVLLRGHRSYLL